MLSRGRFLILFFEDTSRKKFWGASFRFTYLAKNCCWYFSFFFSSVAKSCSKSKRGQYESTAPFLFLRVPLLRKQTVPRRTALGSLRIAEGFFILVRDVSRGRFWILFFRLPVGGKLLAGWCFVAVILFFILSVC